MYEVYICKPSWNIFILKICAFTVDKFLRFSFWFLAFLSKPNPFRLSLTLSVYRSFLEVGIVPWLVQKFLIMQVTRNRPK